MTVPPPAGSAPPRRPAGLVTAFYLLATLPFALATPLRSPLSVAGHLLLLAGAAAAGAGLGRRGIAKLLGDWLPLLAVPFLYAELPTLIAAGGVAYHDGAVQALEATVFPGEPARRLASRYPWGWVSETLHAAYFLYYPLIYVPPAWLYFTRRREGFDTLVTGVAATFAACFLVFAIYPVQGPRYLWPSPGAPPGMIRSLVLSVLESGSSRGTAFPSSHAAVAVVQTLLARRVGFRGWRVCAAVTAGLSLGAVYGGFHYAIDIVAGAAAGTMIAACIVWLERPAPLEAARVDTGLDAVHVTSVQ